MPRVVIENAVLNGIPVTVDSFGKYTRVADSGNRIHFHFCPTCGVVAYWRGLNTDAAGRRRMGFNLRLAEPEAVADIPVHHLDGLDTWKCVDDGRCVKDMWF